MSCDPGAETVLQRLRAALTRVTAGSVPEESGLTAYTRYVRQYDESKKMLQSLEPAAESPDDGLLGRRVAELDAQAGAAGEELKGRFLLFAGLVLLLLVLVYMRGAGFPSSLRVVAALAGSAGVYLLSFAR